MSAMKTVIVTGANSGIGLETAKGLCKLGHDVVISVRDDTKGEATISEIKAQVPNAQIMYLIMDVSDPQSIRDFVDKFLASGKSLHILINNAGVFKLFRSSKRFTARQDPVLEVSMVVNSMGPFLLTNLLLNTLKAAGTTSDPARVVNVSSSITTGKIKPGEDFYLNDLMLAEKGHYTTGKQAYRNSKIALNLWSNELAKRLEGENVVVNTMCPGFIPATGLARDNVTGIGASIMMGLLDSFVGRYLVGTKPVSEGEKLLLRMAFDEDTKTNGLFYCKGAPVQETKEVHDAENMEKIWSLCVKYSGL